MPLSRNHSTIPGCKKTHFPIDFDEKRKLILTMDVNSNITRNIVLYRINSEILTDSSIFASFPRHKSDSNQNRTCNETSDEYVFDSFQSEAIN